jgi:Transposase, Mutator family
MTDVGRMSVSELVGKVLADEHADVLRQAVVWLAQELMEAEVSQAAGAAYGERSGDRLARRNGYRQRAGIPGSARSSWPSHGYGRAPTSPASWSHAAAQSRPWWRWCRRPTSTGCRPARWTGWWRPWAWPGCPRTRYRGSARGWMSK